MKALCNIQGLQSCVFLLTSVGKQLILTESTNLSQFCYCTADKLSLVSFITFIFLNNKSAVITPSSTCSTLFHDKEIVRGPTRLQDITCVNGNVGWNCDHMDQFVLKLYSTLQGEFDTFINSN